MTDKTLSTGEKLAAVERMIEGIREHFGRDDPRLPVFKAIASDIRGRMNGAPSVALCEIERRIVAAQRTKTFLGYENGQMIGIAQEVIGRWAVLKQALERAGATAEIDA